MLISDDDGDGDDGDDDDGGGDNQCVTVLLENMKGTLQRWMSCQN